MTNEMLNEEVARVTGEELSTIEHLGFTQAGPAPIPSFLKLPRGVPADNPPFLRLPFRAEISEHNRNLEPNSSVNK